MPDLTPSEQHAQARCATVRPRIVYGTPRPVRHHPHVTLQTVTVNGYSTWGHRLECHGCGAVDECNGGSSVSWEDHPPRFGYAHRDCGPSDSPLVDAFGRLIP